MLVSLPLFESELLDSTSLVNKDICSVGLSSKDNLITMSDYERTPNRRAIQSLQMNVYTSRNTDGLNGWFSGIDINMKGVLDKLMNSRTCLKRLQNLTKLSAVDFLSLEYEHDYEHSISLVVDIPDKNSDFVREIRHNLFQQIGVEKEIPVAGSLMIWGIFVNSIGFYIPKDNPSSLGLSFKMDLVISKELTIYEIGNESFVDVADNQCLVPDGAIAKIKTIEIGKKPTQRLISAYARTANRVVRFNGRVLF